MAALLTIAVETDAVMDDIRRLVQIHAALAARHGDRFRALDRDIERALEDPCALKPQIAELTDAEGLHLVMTAPAEIHALLARAVALDVRPLPLD